MSLAERNVVKLSYFRRGWSDLDEIYMKFGTLMRNGTPITVMWSKSKPEVEFQYGGCLFQNESSCIWGVDWGMSTKFGFQINFDMLRQ